MTGFISALAVIATVLVTAAIAYRLAFRMARWYGRRQNPTLSLEVPGWGNAFATVIVLGIWLALCSGLLDWIRPAFQPVPVVQIIFSVTQAFLLLLVTWLVIRWEHKWPSSLAALTAVLFVAIVKSCQAAGEFLANTSLDRLT